MESDGRGYIESVIFSDCAAQVGGGLYNSFSLVQGSDISFDSCNASDSGGSVFISNGYLTINSLEMLNTKGVMGADEGGGMSIDNSNVTLTDMICDKLIAEVSACIFAEYSYLVIEKGLIVNNYGFSLFSSKAAVYMISGVVKLSDVVFISNTLTLDNGGQKGTALYVVTCKVRLVRVSFDNHTCLGSGGALFVQDSDLNMMDSNASNSKATTEGGFMKVTGDR